ncbi:hypothetical protein HDU98_000661 [Podochytrium sp. JEL0797]|nr:hypothetical protein HDU98_000661 [Podochytrium sp. JEL0797]
MGEDLEDDEKLRLMIEEAQRHYNTWRAPNLSPDIKLAKATRLKQLCDQIIRQPNHLLFAMAPSCILDASMAYAFSYVNANIYQSHEACRGIVTKLQSRCKTYAHLLGALGLMKDVEHGVAVAMFAGMLAHIELCAGNHEACMSECQRSITEYQWCLDHVKDDCTCGKRQSTLIQDLNQVYVIMMPAAHVLNKTKLVDKFYLAASTHAGLSPSKLIQFRIQYAGFLEDRIEACQGSPLAISTLKSVLLLAIQEAKSENLFGLWGRGMMHVITYWDEFEGNMAKSKECARLRNKFAFLVFQTLIIRHQI